MKKIFVFVTALGALLGLTLWAQTFQTSRLAGFAAPDFALPDLNGAQHRLSDYRGKVVFLNLFTTWCPPCRLEMPAMEQLHQRLRSRGFIVLAVSEDEAGAAVVAPFVRELGLTFPVLLDTENRLPTRYGMTGYPETFLIGRDGNVVKQFIGPEDWLSQDMARYFDALLAQPGGNVAANH